MNTDLAVEKIEIQTAEEQQREYYDSEEDDEDYAGGPGETVIWYYTIKYNFMLQNRLIGK